MEREKIAEVMWKQILQIQKCDPVFESWNEILLTLFEK